MLRLCCVSKDSVHFQVVYKQLSESMSYPVLVYGKLGKSLTYFYLQMGCTVERSTSAIFQELDKGLSHSTCVCVFPEIRISIHSSFEHALPIAWMHEGTRSH